MPTVDELIDLARKNEEIARRLFDIEVQVMNLSHCADFFERLLVLVREKFNLEFVWVSLTNTPANEPLLRFLQTDHHSPEQSEMVGNQLKLVNTIDFLHATKGERSPILINQHLKRYKHLAPGDIFDQIASMAILPLVMEGKVFGSLNLGSTTVSRYQPSMDDFFLQQLAVKVSISLAGVSARQQVSFLASRDPLTLLRNRREMEETLAREISRHQRHGDPLSLLFIDCDDFKQVNDTYGHDAGDVYLRYVADNLAELTRMSDMAFRFAGDEFVVILPNQGRKDAEAIAQRIRTYLIDNPISYQENTLTVVISYGVASTQDMKEVGAATLLKLADEKLYEMKSRKPSQSHQKLSSALSP